MATQIVHRVDIPRLHHEHVVKFDQATSRIKVMRTLHNYFSQATTCTHVLIAKLVELPQNVGILLRCNSFVFPPQRHHLHSAELHRVVSVEISQHLWEDGQDYRL